MPDLAFPQLLAEQVRGSGSRPLVTFYDDATGERVELSVVTYANWVAKTAGLLQDELDLERGATLLVDLPPHWLGTVWLGAAWSLGCAVTPGEGTGGATDVADAVVCGPDGLERYAAAGCPVVAVSLAPMATRFAGPLPGGFVDYGLVVWSQPDAFFPADPPTAQDVAWRRGDVVETQGDLLRRSAGLPDARRVMTDANPVSRTGIDCLLGPLSADGGAVWVRHPDAAVWASRAAAEHVTREVRRGPGAGPA